ncbi:unnamed protein product [Adineta steineri]|uniref:Cytochrome P450 n=1 Tax=Adineta steineri TaxID=433720 RepID=A0A814XKZ0_9BILA|nr:unnamed protein product [Adineta steineri]CAF1216813.1 unnamed protein product [Adineta steineri]
MFIAIILLTILICLITIYLYKIKSSYDYFVRRNIPGPSPQFFFGHYLTLWNVPFYSRQIQKWTQQYGNIYGIFEGIRPVYVVSDVDFLQEVFVKQFSSFHSRRRPFITRNFKGNRGHLFSAQADQWRRQRHVINPTFSAAKLKTMTPLINQCIESFMSKVNDMNGAEFNIYTLYKRMTMDVICRCAFGIDTDMQNDIDNIYMKKSIACFEIDIEKLFIVKLSNVMPFLIPLLSQIFRFSLLMTRIKQKWLSNNASKDDDKPAIWLIGRLEEVLKKRLTSETKRTDLLQLMLDAATEDEIKDDTSEALSSKKLHYNEVVLNTFLFMLAGFETTSNTLAFATSALATTPHVQNKLQMEIDEIWNDDIDNLDYDIIANMTYLDMFVKEVLRMYGISTQAITRESNASVNICGHQIEKGCVILPDVYSVHYDTDIWGPQDPKLFDPERHSVKRHPLAYLAFGMGPRNCVGMRFALMELKMCLVRLLRSYTVHPGEKFQEGMTLTEKFVITPEAINIRLENRHL